SHPNADNRQPDSGKGGEHSRSPSTGAPGTPQTNAPQQSAPYGYGQPGIPPSQQQPNAMYPSPRMAVKNPYQQQQQGYPGYAGPGYHPEQAAQSQHYQGGYATGQPGYQQQPNMWQQRPVYNPAVVQRMGTPDMQQHPAYAQNQRQ
uniref:Uncharacterized protein n=1 Tax=Plectus sambesii TaxID=2011161 RepID=A0A914VSS3_9BILA